MLDHAVVAIFVLLSILSKILEVMIGCEVNEVTPLKVEIEKSVPIVTVPPDKFVPTDITEVASNALMVLTVAIDAFKPDTLMVLIVAVEVFKIETFPVNVYKFEKDTVDAFRTEVFVVITFRSLIVEIDTFKTETLVGPIVIDPPDKLDPIVISES